MLDDLGGDLLGGVGDGNAGVIGEFGADHNGGIPVFCGEVEADAAPGVHLGCAPVRVDVVGGQVHQYSRWEPSLSLCRIAAMATVSNNPLTVAQTATISSRPRTKNQANLSRSSNSSRQEATYYHLLFRATPVAGSPSPP